MYEQGRYLRLRGDVSCGGLAGVEFNEGVVAVVTEAVLRYLSRRRDLHKILIGFDGRRKSETYSRVSVFISKLRGLETALTLYPASLSAVSWLVSEYKFDLAMYITGCHAPSRYCGVKIIDSDGSYLADSDLREIERIIHRELEDLRETCETLELASPDIIVDPGRDYVEHMVSTLSSMFEYRRALRVMLDLGGGSGSGYLDETLRRLGLEVKCVNIGADPDVDVVTEPLQRLQRARELVLQHGLDVGFCLDYDADEVGVAVPEGELCPAEMLALLMPELSRREVKRLACSITSPSLLRESCIQVGVEVIETPPGARFLSEYVARETADMGVDELGVALRGKIPLRDSLHAIALTLSRIDLVRERAESIPENKKLKTLILDPGARESHLADNMEHVARLLEEANLHTARGEYYVHAVSERGRIVILQDIGRLVRICYEGKMHDVVNKVVASLYSL